MSNNNDRRLPSGTGVGATIEERAEMCLDETGSSNPHLLVRLRVLMGRAKALPFPGPEVSLSNVGNSDETKTPSRIRRTINRPARGLINDGLGCAFRSL